MTLPGNIFEEAAAEPRFRVARLVRKCQQYPPFNEVHEAVTKALGQTYAKSTVTGIIRSVFLIEPVNKNITSTKFALRWGVDENRFFAFTSGADPRWCSFEECTEIADTLGHELIQRLRNSSKLDLLRLCIDNRLVSYELPLDYRNIPSTNTRIHTIENIGWQWETSAERTMRLRHYLTHTSDENADVFAAILKDKIKVKVYLTDRAQTGDYQTNREKRWECHPSSVQFALRKTCWEIERELLEQLFGFDDFPEGIRETAVEEGLISSRGEVTRCPVTLNPLSFVDLAEEARNPIHGRAKFQVAHLNPLKSVSRGETRSGHSPDNIAWISADGNRIQGDMTLERIRDLIREISRNYTEVLGPDKTE